MWKPVRQQMGMRMLSLLVVLWLLSLWPSRPWLARQRRRQKGEVTANVAGQVAEDGLWRARSPSINDQSREGRSGRPSAGRQRGGACRKKG